MWCFEPFDFLARLAALVPRPRVHLVRYHGVFAPASRLRAAVTPAGRGRGGASLKPEAAPPKAAKQVSLTWMQRLSASSASRSSAANAAAER